MKTTLLFSAVLFVSALPTLSARAEDPQLLESSVLRRHVQIVAVPVAPTQGDGVEKCIIQSEAWKALLMKEGVAISRDEWAGALDLLQVEVNRSRLFRIVTALPKPAKTAVSETVADRLNAPLALLARFGVGAVGHRVFLHLVEGTTGGTITSVEATADSMQAAVRKALAALEDNTALLAWRCGVIAARDGQMVIDRGRLDGLRPGQKFHGYSLTPEAAKNANDSVELLLLKFGARKGSYEVSEAGQDYSRIKPLEGAPLLTTGDVLELPMITRPDREKDSRSRRLWDQIYDKKN